MKTPIDCPICGDPLLNEYETFFNTSYLNKTCSTKLDHKITIRSWHNPEEMVRWIILQRIHNNSCFIWYFDSTEFLLFTKTNEYKLPWFEPDFSDYPKLLNRLKTCLVFS